jgi:hypothetical protein
MCVDWVAVKPNPINRKIQKIYDLFVLVAQSPVDCKMQLHAA